MYRVVYSVKSIAYGCKFFYFIKNKQSKVTKSHMFNLQLKVTNHSSSVEIEGTCLSKNFDETVRVQSEKRKEWIREIRGERLQGIIERTSSAPRLASSSAELLPGRNECPGTHCSLIEQEERENSSCQGLR